MAEQAENTGAQVENTAEQPQKARKAPVDREEQDRLITADSASALALMDAIQGDEEIAAILAKKGYPADRFAEGRALQVALQEAITARQSAMAVKDAAGSELETKDIAARARYADFRGTARPVFTQSSDRTALKLNGNVPKDRGQFITLARTSYTNAKTAPYADVLKTYGETADMLDEALKGLKALEDADTAQNRASGDAQGTTTARDDAHKALTAWTRQLRGIARNALKQRSDLLAKLGL